MVLELLSIYSQWKIMTPRVWTVWTPGHGWQDLCRGPLDIALYQIYKLWASTSMGPTLMAHSPWLARTIIMVPKGHFMHNPSLP